MGDTRLEPLVLSDAERRILQGWATRRKTAQGLALRARIVLACAEGHSNTAVSAFPATPDAQLQFWHGHGGCEWPATVGSSRSAVAHAARATGRRARGRGVEQPADRGAACHLGAHRRGPPGAHPRQA